MILPQSYLQCLLLLIVGALCLGSWAATYRGSGKWRFELYYVDFAIGVGIAALIFAFTAGNLGFDGFGVIDDLLHAGKRQWLFAFTAGVTFNLANMLIVGAISIAGMAVATMVGAGLGVLLGIGILQLTRTGTNPVLMSGALVLAFAAIAAVELAFVTIMAARRSEIEMKSGKKRRQPSAAKGVIVSLIGGLIMAGTYPLFGRSQGGEVGLGPYTAVALFAAGIVSSTVVFSMFFMNLPLQGEPVEILDYVRGGLKIHFLGLLGGMIWCIGFLATFLSLAAAPEMQPQRFLVYALLLAAPLLGGIWGVAVFREFRESPRANMYALLAILLWGGGIALTLVAQA